MPDNSIYTAAMYVSTYFAVVDTVRDGHIVRDFSQKFDNKYFTLSLPPIWWMERSKRGLSAEIGDVVYTHSNDDAMFSMRSILTKSKARDTYVIHF